jgi:hypothetical protein
MQPGTISLSRVRPVCRAIVLSLVWITASFLIAAAPHAAAQTSAQDAAQTTGPAAAAATVVPQQVRYAGKLAARAGDTVEAVFRIYAAQEGGEALWTETQRVGVAEDGSYTVLLGSADLKGLPQTVFAAGEARWLGVSVERAPELDRVLLASVPYAMKSADAEALAGHKATDFVTQDQLAALSAQNAAAAAAFSPLTSGTVTGSGTAGTVPLWTGSLTQGNANIVQVGNNIGINEATPAATLDVGGPTDVRGTLSLPSVNIATTGGGSQSQLLELSSSAWSTTTNSAVPQTFQFLAEPTGNDTATPGGALYLAYQNGTATPTNLLSIASTGQISFAPSQLFPGTITGALGTSPIVTGVSGHNITVQLNTTALETTLDNVFAQTGVTNTFHGNQTVLGSLDVTALLTGEDSVLSGSQSAQSFVATGAIIAKPPAPATATTGVNSPFVELTANSYSSSTSASVPLTYAWEAQPTGNDTASPAANLALLYETGTPGLSPTGLSISPKGVITFSPTQTFPGSVGTITGITTTSPLTGSGTSGSVALGLNTAALETTLNAVYPELATANTFALGASFGGPITASASVSGQIAVTATGTNGAEGLSASSDTNNAGSFGNNTAPYATVYAANSASFSSSVNYYPVAINATASGTSSIGSYGNGTAAGMWGNSSAGMGVWGSSGSVGSVPTLTTTGVVGEGVAPQPGNAGVLGYTAGSQSTSYAYEVARDGIAGVWGDTTGNPASDLEFSAAVMGTTDALDGYGGVFIANSAESDAMFAKNLSSGAGVYGESLGTGVSNNAGTGGTGVNGFTPSPAEGQAGVLGYAYQLSGSYSTVKATGPVGFVAGVWGDAGEVNDGTGTYEAGVVGTGDDITAALFQNNSPSGHPTLSAVSTYAGTTQTLFKSFIATTPDGTCGFGGAGDMTCTGQVKALAATGGGTRRVETYSVQSPENWMEDFGSGNVERGVAVVQIEPAFAETVTADANYHVFITPNGDSKGLYVIRKTATSFEVRESGGGTSSLSFDYRIVAKRRGYEAQRLTDVTERFNAERAQAMPPQRAMAERRVRPGLSSPGMAAPGMAAPARTLAPRHEPARSVTPPVRVGGGRTIAVAHPEPEKRR